MKWLAAVLAAAVAAAPLPHHHHACRQRCPPPHVPAPAPTAAPTAVPTAVPLPTAPPAPTVTATPLPSRSSVTFDDTRDPWTLAPAHDTFAAGAITFTAYDYGQDDHNLSVDSESRTIHYGSVDVPAGTADDPTPPALTVDLPAGRYVLFCDLPGHEAAGMSSTITVR